MKILVVGVGSVLRGDDAVGVRVIDELEKQDLPKEINIHRGDISGLDLLKIIPGHERAIIIDAADMKEAPGTIRIFSFNEIREAGFSNMLSTHGMTLLETLTLAEKLDLNKTCEMTIIGIQPEDVSFNLDMSPLIKGKIQEIVETVKTLL
jgi:hydrogenase maturation protease